MYKRQKYDHIRASLTIKSDNSPRDFKVYDAVTSEVYAEISKRATRSGEDMLVEPDNYQLTVNPGVDVLFMAALTLMYEYALSDMDRRDN